MKKSKGPAAVLLSPTAEPSNVDSMTTPSRTVDTMALASKPESSAHVGVIQLVMQMISVKQNLSNGIFRTILASRSVQLLY